MIFTLTIVRFKVNLNHKNNPHADVLSTQAKQSGYEKISQRE
jgi:hypothetical protein